MQRLVDAITASIDPVLLMRRVAEQTCLFTPQANGALVSVCTPDRRLANMSAHGVTTPLLGRIVPLHRTFPASTLHTCDPEVVHDVHNDTRLSLPERSLAAELDIQSFVAIPLLHNGASIGVLTVVSAQPSVFDESAVAALASMSRLVAALIGSHSELSRLLHDLFEKAGATSHGDSTTAFLAELFVPGRAENDRLHTDLDDLFAPEGIQAVFQPVVDLRTRTTMAVEGLSRFSSATDLDTAQWFSRARLLHRGIDLERHALRTVVDASRLLPADLPVAVNLSPVAALDSTIQEILLTADRDLVVEITEHEPFPSDLKEALEPLRDNGIRVAVDDAGAGYANLAEILRLKPDIIKIDGELTLSIDRDPVRRALTYSIIRLADEIGAVTVAEAVEDDAQCEVLRQTGVQYGQGYFLGAPAPADVYVGAAGP